MKFTTLVPIAAAVLLSACAGSHAHTRAHHAEAHHAGAHYHMPAMQHTVVSKYGFNDTVARLQTAFKAQGMTVFAVIDHQAAAKAAGLAMQPAKVIVFGTPKAGTPLMVKDPDFALQLPLKVLVTESGGEVRVVFHDVHALIHGSKIGYGEVENTLAKAGTLIMSTVSE